MANILIIEDDLTFAGILKSFLERNKYHVMLTHSVKDGIAALQQHSYDLVLLDYRLPDGTGLDILDHTARKEQAAQVLMMTSFNDVRTAVKAMRMGVYDYITKPVNPDELLMVLQQVLRKENKIDTPRQKQEFVEGTSKAAEQINQYIRLIAPTDMSVIIEGESGTGKEQAARKIHKLSKRASGPFIAIDCGTLSAELAASELFGHQKGAFTGALHNHKGQFEEANGGTIFLDEVGNLGYEVQVKLLRAIQERTVQPLGSNKQVNVDVRIITATNDDLVSSVKAGKFREDLYHRINEFKIKLPALKERGEDIELFISHFISQANKELGKNITGIAPAVRTLFYNYDWPGNLRELKNIIKRAVLLSTGTVIDTDALPDDMATSVPQISNSSSDLKSLQENSEREMIIKTLKEVKYNKSKAAKLLNIDRTTLYYKISKYNIEA